MREGETMKPKVAFICVHNSCRSQMAEAVAKLTASDTFEAFSAGTEIVPQINQTAVKLVKERYGLDMNSSHKSKTLDAIPKVDIIITMGCNVDCPWLPSKHREDWGLDDPSGKEYSEYEKTLDSIEEKVKSLVQRIKNGKIEL